jgi:hypothetical protein
MKISIQDTKNIALTACGGFVAFATLAFGNTLIRKKLVGELKVETTYLAKHDELLMILLADVEEHVYDDIDPVAYIRLVDSCDLLLEVKVLIQNQSQSQKLDASQLLDMRIDCFLHWKRAISNIERLKTHKNIKNGSYFESLDRIQAQLTKHKEIVYILTEQAKN